MNRALFLDRDGVILQLCTKRGPLEVAHCPEEIEFIPSIESVIHYARELGWFIVLVSNQPDVARGKATIEDVQGTMKAMEEKLARMGAALDKVYYCLHQSEAHRVVRGEYLVDCRCRKPHPGMLLQAARDLNIDLRHSLMVGDRVSDIEAGAAAGCKTILFHNEQYHPSIFFGRAQESTIRPDFIISDLDALRGILQSQHSMET